MNYKFYLLSFIRNAKKQGIEIRTEEGTSSEAFEKACDLAYAILEKRFENDLKQYNQDMKKAYDLFTAKKNVQLLTFFVEEIILLDKPADKLPEEKAVQKQMRSLINQLHLLLS